MKKKDRGESNDSLSVIIEKWSKSPGYPNSYKIANTENVNLLMQWSTAPRNRYVSATGIDMNAKELPSRLDIIVQQITANPTQQGHGTRFMLKLTEIAKKYNRGVQLQQTITSASMKLSNRLKENHGWYSSPYDQYSAFSP